MSRDDAPLLVPSYRGWFARFIIDRVLPFMRDARIHVSSNRYCYVSTTVASRSRITIIHNSLGSPPIVLLHFVERRKLAIIIDHKSL